MCRENVYTFTDLLCVRLMYMLDIFVDGHDQHCMFSANLAHTVTSIISIIFYYFDHS